MVDYPAVGIKGQGEVLDEFLKVSFNPDGTLKTAGGSATLTNKSGGAVAIGDLVWIAYGSDNSFTTSTTQDKTDGIPGVALAAIANNAAGAVALGGHIEDVNFTGTPTIGQFVRQSSSAKLCEGVTTMTSGCFAKVARVTSQDDIIFLSKSEYLENAVSIVTQTALSNFTAGDNELYTDATEESTGGTSYVKIKDVLIPRGGTLRIKVDLKSSGSPQTAYARIYRNGSPVGAEQTETGTSYVTKSQDIPDWSAGDNMQVYIKATSGFTAFLENFIVYEGGETEFHFVS